MYLSLNNALKKYDLSMYLIKKYMEKMQQDKHFVILIDGKIRFDSDELHRFLTIPSEKQIKFDLQKFL
jgi:hypothetical protein